MAIETAYFDAAYLFKLLWDEQGSDDVRALAARCSQLVCAAHGRAEVIAAAHRKFCEAVAGRDQIATLLDQFAADCMAGGIAFLPLDDAVFERLESAFRSAPATAFLRAADALHLACAAENGFSKVYSNDRHLIAAASIFGLEGVDIAASPAAPWQVCNPISFNDAPQLGQCAVSASN